MPAIATIDQLANELVTRIKAVNDFANAGFYVYSLEELSSIIDNGTVGFPLVGISYEGAEVTSNSQNPSRQSVVGSTLKIRFSVILAVNYQYVTDSDNKKHATDMLDLIRNQLLGYKGVNNRPWFLNGEYPVDGDAEGVIYYGQLWETDLPVTGTFQQP